MELQNTQILLPDELLFPGYDFFTLNVTMVMVEMFQQNGRSVADDEVFSSLRRSFSASK